MARINVTITHLPQEDGLREVGDLALWSVSSFKRNFGVENVRNGDLETFWQSDAPQPAPHTITMQFPRLLTLAQLSFYVSFAEDESYTPHKISIRAGGGPNELSEMYLISLDKPVGWVNIPLRNTNNEEKTLLRAHIVQLAVLANHQNGKDSHFREVRIYTPSEDTSLDPNTVPYTSIECLSQSCIR
ncbi:anaphase-promoting complex, subunit 10/DOC domain-containing protein [Syncephalis fuscata]|nr:anaphase-promoting complex, subunit 10/DOC domain-containing protein [Syncephalis fuscata]